MKRQMGYKDQNKTRRLCHETEGCKKYLWLRFVLVQASNACLFLAVLIEVALHGLMMNQLIFWLLSVVIAFRNYLLITELKKELPAGTFANPTMKRQLAFASVSGALSVLGFYQLATTADDFQKVTGFLCGLVCGGLAILLILGIQYVLSSSKQSSKDMK